MSRHDRHKDLQLAQLRSFCLAATQGSFAEAIRTSAIATTTSARPFVIGSLGGIPRSIRRASSAPPTTSPPRS